MAADPVLSRELKSLQEEIAASQRARAQSPPDRPIASEAEAARGAAAMSVSQPEEGDEEQRQRGELRELVDEATRFFEEAEKNISAHPAAAVVGALVAGILIGRLLGRR